MAGAPSAYRQRAQTLPDTHRDALRLRYARGLSYSEIAEELRVPLGTVKTWLFRGRKGLAEGPRQAGVGSREEPPA